MYKVINESNIIKKIIGENIAAYRQSNGLSQEDIVKYLKEKNIKDYQISSYNAIEKGSRGTSPIVLFELSKLFNVSMESFFLKKEIQLKEPTEVEKKRNKLKVIFKTLDNDELDCVISIVETVRKLIDLKKSKITDSTQEYIVKSLEEYIDESDFFDVD